MSERYSYSICCFVDRVTATTYKGPGLQNNGERYLNEVLESSSLHLTKVWLGLKANQRFFIYIYNLQCWNTDLGSISTFGKL